MLATTRADLATARATTEGLATKLQTLAFDNTSQKALEDEMKEQGIMEKRNQLSEIKQQIALEQER